MPSSIIRGKHVITRALDRHRYEQLDDAAILQRDGIITAIDSFATLHRQHPDLPVTGTGDQVLLPGFVNGHHHVGLTPLQLGSPDMPLELWFATRLVLRDVDLYLDTLYSAFDMVSSGITTVQHIHGWASGGLTEVETKADNVIRAYEDLGMRVSYCYALRDQNHLVYEANDAFMARVPEDLRPALGRHFARFRLNADDLLALFASLHARHHNKERVKVQLAPANLHWCSDRALTLLADASEQYNAPMHMHLVETAYQKEYAHRRGGGTALDYIDRFGLLGSRMTIGHGVWLNERDIDRVAETGTHICHNCSSNFRLRSGIAPLNRWRRRASMSRSASMKPASTTIATCCRKCAWCCARIANPAWTIACRPWRRCSAWPREGGAKTTPYAAQIGTLEVGKAADTVLIDWQQISYPYLDSETPVLDAVICAPRSPACAPCWCAGEVIYQDGRFTRVDRDAALRQLSELLQRDLTAEEQERRRLAKAILPHVKAFYDGYWNAASHQPFYSQSSRS